MRLSEEERRAISQSRESVRALAQRHGVSPTTIQKWRNRDEQANKVRARPELDSLGAEERMLLIALRRAVLLPLDDALAVAHVCGIRVSRSSLHRLWREYDLHEPPRLVDLREVHSRLRHKGSERKSGHFYVSTLRMETEDQQLQLLVAVDRHTHFVIAELWRNSEIALLVMLRRLSDFAPPKSVFFEMPGDEDRRQKFNRDYSLREGTVHVPGPWRSEQLAPSDVMFEMKQFPSPDRDELIVHEMRLRRLVNVMNSMPLKARRRKSLTERLMGAEEPSASR
jgi:transposase-like protein